MSMHVNIKRILIFVILIILALFLISCSTSKISTLQTPSSPIPTIDLYQQLNNELEKTQKTIADYQSYFSQLPSTGFIHANSCTFKEDSVNSAFLVELTYEIKDSDSRSNFSKYYGMDEYRILKEVFNRTMPKGYTNVRLRLTPIFYYKDDLGNISSAKDSLWWTYEWATYKKINHSEYEGMLLEKPWLVFSAGDGSYSKIVWKISFIKGELESDKWFDYMAGIDQFFKDYFTETIKELIN